MKSQDIENVLKEFIGNAKEHSLLIDGKWGCGKTYHVLKFLDEKQKSKIYYISVFGYSSTDEINTALYWKIHKGFKTVADVGILISKVINPLVKDYVDIKEGLSYALKRGDKAIGPDNILILDDIERVGKKLDYIDLCGYITHLILNKSKVIAICDSTHVSLDKKESFQEFLEKTFDRILTINETPEEIIEDKLKGSGIQNIDSIVGLIDNNLRLVERSIIIYQTITEKLSKEKIELVSITKNEFFVLCVVAVRASFSICIRKVDKEQGSEFRNKYGDGPAESMLEWIGNINAGIDLNPNIAYIPLLEGIYEVVAFNSYTKLLNELKPKVDKSAFQSTFFMSDDEKASFVDATVKSLVETSEPIDHEKVDVLYDIFKYTPCSISQKDRKNIIRKCYISMEPKKMIDNLYLAPFDKFMRNNEIDLERKTRLEQWRVDIEDVFIDCLFEKLALLIDKPKQDDDWLVARDLLYWVDNQVGFASVNFIERIKMKFIQNGFYLPDLSSSISPQEWKYCIMVGRCVQDYKIVENFKSFAEIIVNEHPDNFSLKDRIKTIV